MRPVNPRQCLEPHRTRNAAHHRCPKLPLSSAAPPGNRKPRLIGHRRANSAWRDSRRSASDRRTMTRIFIWLGERARHPPLLDIRRYGGRGVGWPLPLAARAIRPGGCRLIGRGCVRPTYRWRRARHVPVRLSRELVNSGGFWAEAGGEGPAPSEGNWRED